MRSTATLAMAFGLWLSMPVVAVAVLLGLLWWITRDLPQQRETKSVNSPRETSNRRTPWAK